MSIERSANAFVSNARAQWKELVLLACSIRPNQRADAARTLAQAAGIGKSTLQRKLEALHLAMQDGLSPDTCIELGQARVLAKYVKAKREARDDAQVVLKWLVNPETRDAAHELFWRIGKTLNRKTSEELWDFILSVFADLDEASLHHLAGNGEVKRAPQRSGPQ